VAPCSKAFGGLAHTEITVFRVALRKPSARKSSVRKWLTVNDLLRPAPSAFTREATAFLRGTSFFSPRRLKAFAILSFAMVGSLRMVWLRRALVTRIAGYLLVKRTLGAANSMKSGQQLGAALGQRTRTASATSAGVGAPRIFLTFRASSHARGDRCWHGWRYRPSPGCVFSVDP